MALVSLATITRDSASFAGSPDCLPFWLRRPSLVAGSSHMR